MDDQGGRFRKKKTNFSMVSNELIKDESISLKAKGLYALIQCYITMENFTLYKGFLRTHCCEGKKAFEAAWKELKDAGYLLQYRMKDFKNHFYYEYELLDFPVPPKVDTGKGGVQETGCPQKVISTKGGIPETGLYSNTESNNTLNNNTISNHILSINTTQEQIGYDTFPQADREQLDEIVLLITETLNMGDEAVLRVSKQDIPARLVKERFQMLNQFHIQYVLDMLKSRASNVGNIKNYLLTMLYNAPATMNGYYQQQIRFDFDMCER